MLGRDYPRTTHQGWPVITIANTAGASNNKLFFLLLFLAWSKIIVYILFFSRESCCSLAFCSVIKEA